MTRPFHNHAELRDLLDALCEETITEEQVRRLEELVLGHPEAEALYVQYLSLHADLAAYLAVLPCPTEQTLRDRARPDKPGEPAGVSRRDKPAVRVRRLLTWGGIGLTGLAAGLALALVLGPRPAPPPRPWGKEQAGERIDDTVAVLLRAPDAVWGKTELPTRAGAALPAGWLRLKAGYAHLEFYSGATVILEGPAELRLISRMEAYCALGKLRAMVPPHAQGFTIGSPRLDLIDRGTEFGLRIDAGQTEVHVFEGKVELYDPGKGGNAPPRQELTTGRGLRLDGPGHARPIAPEPGAFRTAAYLARRSEAQTQRLHQGWQRASAAERKDPSMVVYYPFEAEGDWSRALLDQARGRQQSRDGAIVGCPWVQGRWPGKKALEFKRVSDRVRLNIPGEFDSLTLAAWVRIDGLPNKNNALLMADGWEEGEVHWQIGDNGTIILGVQSSPKGRGAHYHAPAAITPDRFGLWAHLAVVYDRDNGWVTHYVDGQPTAPQPLEFDIPLRIGDAEIGNWNLASHRNRTPVRFFSGCIDELMVFNRALGDGEVKRLSAQGRPPQ